MTDSASGDRSVTLQRGAQLGPYEIVSLLGAGGMGEVYRARDSRLLREVAIKVLPVGLASDPERLKRFEREARSASALNHTNIVTIYDIGSADSVSYIAMELVEGEPLRGLLVSGALPTKQLLQIGTQIADGLAKAHAAGIVHRDLKPENVMVTEDGLVKILDFGLAKLTQADTSGSSATLAPTVSGATQEGVILGTVGYMSPEQATGGSLDFRSDQFALGSILYEMATGNRAFQRASAPQTLTAIIQDEPEPIAAVNPKIPAPVRWIVDRCLAKQPKSRYTSTDDLAKELAMVRDRLSEATSAISPSAEMPATRWRHRWIPALAIAAVLLALGIVGLRLRQKDYFWKNPFAEARFARFTDWPGSERDAAISSDGNFVGFISDRAGPFDAWVGQVGGGQFLNLTHGRYANLATPLVTRGVGFSDDGAHLWLMEIKLSTGRVWFVPTMGGEPQLFLPNAVALAWSPDRKQLAYHTGDPGDPIFIADRNGRNPRQILGDKPGLHNHFPTWSPDGRFIYFVHGPVSADDNDVWRVSSTGGIPERLTFLRARVAYPTLIDDRTLLFTAVGEEGAWRVYGMDVTRRIPHRVSFGVEEYMSLSSSADGRRLVATVANPTLSLWFAPIADRAVDDSGLQALSLTTVRAADPRFGPDYVVYLSSRGGPYGLWKLKAGVETELWKGNDGPVAAAPTVSKDGTQIAFAVRSGEHTRLYAMAPDGTNARPVTDALDVRGAPSWSPDGGWIAVVAPEGDATPLFKVPVGGGKPVRLAEGVLSSPVWSPDGRLILYTLNQRGATSELRGVTPDGQPFPLPVIPEVGTLGDRYRFLPDGRSIVVTQGLMWKQDFWLVNLFNGSRRQLTNLGPEYRTRSFDVSPDGKKILFDRYRENSDVVLIDLPPR